MTEPEQAVEFFGETFPVPDAISATAVMRFAKGSQRGVDSRSLEGMVLQYDLLQQCIAPDDWERFEKTADDNRANGDHLWEVINKVFELRAERPTLRSSGSPDGPPATTPKSESVAVKQAVLAFPGRPDLQIAVPGVREALSA